MGLQSLQLEWVLPLLKGVGKHDATVDWTSHDIAIGTSFELPSHDMFGRIIDPEARTLIVFAGACSQCSLNAVPPEKLYGAKYDQLVLLYLSSERQLHETFSGPDRQVMLVADPKGNLVSDLGAQSAPRFYVVNQGRIEAVWKDTFTWPKAWVPADTK